MIIKNVFNEVKDITYKLIDSGLADEYNFPICKDNKVYWNNQNDVSIAMKNIPYREIYNILLKNKNYNIKLPDGGLLQFMYEFDKEGLLKHRLAFFPSPYLEEFQNNPDIYMEDILYGDVVSRQVMPVIVRVDYNRIEIDSNTHHPYCHMTLGQYKNCRIPVEKSISPSNFTEFILENFYYIPSKSFLSNDFKKLVSHNKEHIAKEDLKKIYFKIS
ncbi:DUF2290 domain-containing protein [Clostridium perfringens]|uniref:DUF2290 domain-containing protein n=1 Tax=Clostridium perfringens TaxID=1502 RepID=UPI0022259C4D|nr:DUF2290 domain-containing protein [Clostridium perfringens]UYX11371.1 DUF2290 domain-containing protein [Clostridium perfringens]